ncbi:MAG TPA: hypothetical protein VJB11_02855 [archaeon]|nr:hypothetical protein [archaeon]
MANRHIKIINGRKYYYESIRMGKKVTSRYLGPVEAPMRKPKEQKEEATAEDAQQPEDDYIG